MKLNLKILVLSSIILLIIDLTYLSFIGKYYGKMIKEIQGSEMNTKKIPAAICYLLLIISVNYFILHDTKRGYLDAFILGFVIYGVFDSTNQAIIKKWNPYLSIIDTIWGGILMTLTTFITLKVFPR